MRHAIRQTCVITHELRTTVIDVSSLPISTVRRLFMEPHIRFGPRHRLAARAMAAPMFAAVSLVFLTACNRSAPVQLAPVSAYTPQFTEGGQLVLPAAEIWREWPQVGTPLTPNALNGGEAPFPEFHSVYIDPVSWQHWRQTGEFREGTVLAKELLTVHGVDALPDGSTQQVSGRGYFMGAFSGFEIAYKSAAHFPDEPGNWAYFSFGHHAPPYAEATSKMPVASCNSCHAASAARDFVFTQFYPVLRAAKAKR
jgi:hypothetical protein